MSAQGHTEVEEGCAGGLLRVLQHDTGGSA